MSALAWITFVICTLSVIISYCSTGDMLFLLYALPALASLVIIPVTLRWMSQKSFSEASKEYENSAKPYKIKNVGVDKIGIVLKVSGRVEKISFTWLKRPHFEINDSTAVIKLVMFSSPEEKIKVGDSVEAIGVVMKNLFSRNTPVISAIKIKTL